MACRSALPGVAVECPPGILYPPGVTPPSPLRILFIGVAPPKQARHFYTDPKDKLRLGLFRSLPNSVAPLTSIPDFLARGFFLVHTAKCPIRGTTKPNLDVSRYCSRRFLAREIASLRPAAICGLSANIAYPVLRDLSVDWKMDLPLSLGIISRGVVADRPCAILATKYPTRQWLDETRTHLGELLRVVN
jgi:hypothetical protein